jgi:hypothetical protein
MEAPQFGGGSRFSAGPCDLKRKPVSTFPDRALERQTFNWTRKRRSIPLFKHRTENRFALFGPML